MKRPCPVIFDLDGTLIDSAPDIHAAANAILAERGLAPLSLVQVRSFVGKGVPHLVQCLLEASHKDPHGPMHGEMMRAFAARYEKAVHLTTLYPGVREALSALAAKGHPLGICTNKPIAPTRAVLAHFGLLDSFGAILGGDSLPMRKPDPAPLIKCLWDLGVWWCGLVSVTAKWTPKRPEPRGCLLRFSPKAIAGPRSKTCRMTPLFRISPRWWRLSRVWRHARCADL